MYIDDNGDAAGNYTVLALRSIEANHSLTDGLHPIGTFSQPNGNQIPVRGFHLGCILFIYSNLLSGSLTHSCFLYVRGAQCNLYDCIIIYTLFFIL